MENYLELLTETDYLPFMDNNLNEEDLKRVERIKSYILKNDLDKLYEEFDFAETEMITHAEIDNDNQIHIYYVDIVELELLEFDTIEEAANEINYYNVEHYDIRWSQASSCWTIKIL